MKIAFSKIRGGAMLTASLGYLYYQWKNPNRCALNPQPALFLKLPFPRGDINTLCPRNFSSKLYKEKFSTVDLLFSEMEADFNQSKDLTFHLLSLKTHLEKEKSTQEAEYVAKKMILFLRKHVFFDSIDTVISALFYRIHPVSTTFSELEKDKLLRLECFFHFMNATISKIEDIKLIEEIKILFANLPYKGNREGFSNLFLDQKEQITILVKALQKQEDALVKEILDRLENGSIFFTPKEEKIVKKLLFPEESKEPFSLAGELSEANQMHLLKTLENAQQRQKLKGLKFVLADLFQRCDAWERQELSWLPEGPVKLLQRVSKCKSYFKQQCSLPTQEITIPYWYHATKSHALSLIIQSHQVNVFYRKGQEKGYTGAWVSSHIESSLFGRNVIAFTKKIEKPDEDVRRSLFFPSKRWRGFMKPLPLDHAILFSIKQDQNKEMQKQEKIRLYRELSSSLASRSSFKIVSEKQMLFMQKKIVSVLGHPNLDDSLWGYT